MRRKPRPPKPDLRQPWQIEQGNRCGCKGTDDMCACQNENPWPRPRRDYEGEIRTLELQQQTDRQTIASLLARAEAAESRLSALERRPSREAVAREIDSYAFAPIKWLPAEAQMKTAQDRARTAALAKADRVLALFALPGEEEEQGSSVAGLPAHVADATATEAQRSAGLARFAIDVLQALWEGHDLDGADIQDLGLAHGLICETTFDPEEHDDVLGVGAMEGDQWFVPQPWLERLAKSSGEQSISPSEASADDAALDEHLNTSSPTPATQGEA